MGWKFHEVGLILRNREWAEKLIVQFGFWGMSSLIAWGRFGAALGKKKGL